MNTSENKKLDLAPEGFAMIRNGIREHYRAGKLSLCDLGLFTFLNLECRWDTGVYHGTAEGISFALDRTVNKEQVKRYLRRLREKRYINYKEGTGSRGGYDILIHKFRPRLGKLVGTELNAWKHEGEAKPAYEPITAEGTGEGTGAASREGTSQGSAAASLFQKEPEVNRSEQEVTQENHSRETGQTERFAETKDSVLDQHRETLDPQKSKAFDFPDEDDDEPLPPVHSQQPQARVIPSPTPVAKIVRRDKGHRFAQTYNGLKCLACKKHFTTYERDRSFCQNEEMDIDAVDTPRPVKEVPAPIFKEIPKPDPADYDMDDRFGRSEYKRALMDWQDSQRANGASA
jgi:hypothetical protein